MTWPDHRIDLVTTCLVLLAARSVEDGLFAGVHPICNIPWYYRDLFSKYNTSQGRIQTSFARIESGVLSQVQLKLFGCGLI